MCSSDLGQALAEKLGRSFVDADAEIVKVAGKSIPDIFAESGESGFRAIETQVLAQLGKRSGLIIATGGGCVTREENYPLLHQNGTIVWLKRDIELLPTEGRPLSVAGALQEMYRIRKPMYQRFADCTIENSGDIQSTVTKILDALETIE